MNILKILNIKKKPIKKKKKSYLRFIAQKQFYELLKDVIIIELK